MKVEMRYVSPVRAGVVLAVLYGLIMAIIVPFFILAAMSGRNSGGAGVLLLVALPFLYAAGGFIGGIISAALYNLVASWTGGLEFEFKDGQSGANQYLQRR